MSLLISFYTLAVVSQLNVGDESRDIDCAAVGVLKKGFRESNSMRSYVNYVLEFTWVEAVLNCDRFIVTVRYVVICSLSCFLEAEWFNQSSNVFCKSLRLNNDERSF